MRSAITSSSHKWPSGQAALSSSESSLLPAAAHLQHSGPCLLTCSVLLAGLDKDCRLTEPLGMRIAEFPLNPMFAKMLLESGGWTTPFDFMLVSLNSVHPGRRDQSWFKSGNSDKVLIFD